MVLLDTYAWAWSLSEPDFLSPVVRDTLLTAPGLAISSVSFYEIAQKVRLGKWPQMAAHLRRLENLAAAQSVSVLSIAADVALLAGQLDWSHRDPFDRMLAATALVGRMDFVSIDTAFDDVPGLRRIW